MQTFLLSSQNNEIFHINQGVLLLRSLSISAAQAERFYHLKNSLSNKRMTAIVMSRNIAILPTPDFRNILNWKWTLMQGLLTYMSSYCLITLCRKEDWLQHLLCMGEHDGSYLHFHQCTLFEWVFLIIEATSVFTFADTGSLFDKTMHQLSAEHYWFKINFSDAAQLPYMNVTCFSRGGRAKSQVTAHSMWQGLVSLEEIWLPLAATCQFQQLFAA